MWIFTENYDSRSKNRKKRQRAYLLGWSSLARLILAVLLLQLFPFTTADYYAGYIRWIIKNETRSSCEGGYLKIQCPVMTTIAVQGAMYGRKVPSNEMCPVTPQRSPQALMAEDVDCEAVTSLAKTARECEDKRVCQLHVHSSVFGSDPCPNTTKYLTVKYKCRLMTDELRTRAACYDRTIRLRCPREKTYIAIYNVELEQNPACGFSVAKNCNMTSDDALNYVTKRCHKQQKCVLPLTTDTCGNFFRVEYACLPKRILTEQAPSSVLSAVQSADDVIDTSPPAASYTTESSALGPDVPFVPKIVSVHPPMGASQTNSTSPILFVTTIHDETTILTTNKPKHTFTTNEALSTLVGTSKAIFNDESTTVPNLKDEAFQTVASNIQPTSKNWEETDVVVQATNEFPMPHAPRKEAENDAATTAEVSRKSLFNSTISSMTIFNTTILGLNYSNETLPQEFLILNAITQLITFIGNNFDRFLVVLLASLCVALFLALLFFMFRCEQRECLTGKRRKPTGSRNGTEDSQNGECASLVATSHRSQVESSSTSPANVFSTQPSQSIPDRRRDHINYFGPIQDCHLRRKKRSRTHILLKKWCSCCCTNAPWQRDHSDSEESYQIAPRSTSLSDDGVISAVGETRSQFVGPLPVYPPSSQPEEAVVDNRFVQPALSGPETDGIPYADEDNASEYDFPDNNPSPSTARSAPEPPPLVRPTTLQHTFRPHQPAAQQPSPQAMNTIGAMHSPLPVTRNPYQRSTQVQPQMYGPPKQSREPPPFPKPPANFGYQGQPSPNYPHYVTQRPSNNQPMYQLQQPESTNFNPNLHQPPQQRYHQAYHPGSNDHYVALRPQQQHHPNVARTLNLNHIDDRADRRDSFYDNSLPRDSPIYEYYQRQQGGRQELPGTRNINQYFT